MKSVIWMAVLIAASVSAQSKVEPTDGPALYKDYCASCHGADGKGFGPMSQWLKIKSPDLTRLSIRESGKFPLARVERIILGEVDITSGGRNFRSLPRTKTPPASAPTPSRNSLKRCRRRISRLLVA